MKGSEEYKDHDDSAIDHQDINETVINATHDKHNINEIGNSNHIY